MIQNSFIPEVLTGSNTTCWGYTSWRVIDGDVLEVEHRDSDGDSTTALFRLVPVERRYVPVDGA